MNLVEFYPEEGGNIRFEYDAKKYYAIVTSGTSVPLHEEEPVFVPDVKCRCSNPSCNGRQSYFTSQDVVAVTVKPESQHGDVQDYAGRFSCFVNVYLYDKDKVDATRPQGYALASATHDEQNDTYLVVNFLQ